MRKAQITSRIRALQRAHAIIEEMFVETRDTYGMDRALTFANTGPVILRMIDQLKLKRAHQTVAFQRRKRK